MINFLNDLTYIGNELFLLFSSYFILLFTLRVPEIEQRYNFGYLYLTIFAITTAWNFIMLLIILAHDLKDGLRLKSMKTVAIRKKYLKDQMRPENISLR